LNAILTIVGVVEKPHRTDIVARRARLRQQRTVRLAGAGACERLALLPEEAFFLAAALGRLRVALAPPPDACDTALPRVLDAAALWRVLAQAAPGFPARAAAYTALRGRGWVPRSGLRLGADYVVYRGGPTVRHAEAVVLLHERCAACLRTQHPMPSRQQPAAAAAVAATVCAECGAEERTEQGEWARRVRAGRLAAHVVKDLLVLDVLRPPGTLLHPDCLQRFVVADAVWARTGPA
jgi:hypothetical protein